MNVSFTGVSYSYRRHQVLSNLDWTVSSGITGLVGPNAAGKSTLLTLMVGYRHLQSGRITVGDSDLSTKQGRAGARRKIGYLPQRFSLVSAMTVRETVEYAAWLNGLPHRAAASAAAEALGLVGLADRRAEKVRTLSGGLRQRLGIAAAIAHRPEVVVLDEPTVGLDPGQRIRIREVIRRLGQGRTVVLSTHLIEDVANLCSTVAILDSGRLAYHGRVDELVAARRSDGGEPALSAELERAYDRLLDDDLDR